MYNDRWPIVLGRSVLNLGDNSSTIINRFINSAFANKSSCCIM